MIQEIKKLKDNSNIEELISEVQNRIGKWLQPSHEEYTLQQGIEKDEFKTGLVSYKTTLEYKYNVYPYKGNAYYLQVRIKAESGHLNQDEIKFNDPVTYEVIKMESLLFGGSSEITTIDSGILYTTLIIKNEKACREKLLF